MKFDNLKIGVRLGLGFSILLLLLAAVAGIGITRLEVVGTTNRAMVEEDLATARIVREWVGLADVTGVRSVAALEAGSEEGTRFFLDTIATTTKRGVELQRQLQERVADDPQAKALFAETQAIRTPYRAALDAAFKARAAGDTAEAHRLMGAEVKPRLEALGAAQRKLAQHLQGRLDARAAKVEDAFRSGRVQLLSLSAAAFAAGIAEAVAGGDLSVQADTEGRDEIAQLLRALHDMDRQARAHRGRCPQRHRQHRDRLRADRRRQPRPVGAHRTAGRPPVSRSSRTGTAPSSTPPTSWRAISSPCRARP